MSVVDAALSAQQLTTTYNCRTPGCSGEAKAKNGRHAYTTACRVQRGTALPDGTPIPGKITVGGDTGQRRGIVALCEPSSQRP